MIGVYIPRPDEPVDHVDRRFMSSAHLPKKEKPVFDTVDPKKLFDSADKKATIVFQKGLKEVYVVYLPAGGGPKNVAALLHEWFFGYAHPRDVSLGVAVTTFLRNVPAAVLTSSEAADQGRVQYAYQVLMKDPYGANPPGLVRFRDTAVYARSVKGGIVDSTLHGGTPEQFTAWAAEQLAGEALVGKTVAFKYRTQIGAKNRVVLVDKVEAGKLGGIDVNRRQEAESASEFDTNNDKGYRSFKFENIDGPITVLA